MIAAVSALVTLAAHDYFSKEKIEIVENETTSEPFFELSLAQWSMHKMINEDGVDPYSFAEKAKNWGFTGLEYVSQLYNPELANANYSEEARTDSDRPGPSSSTSRDSQFQ